MDSVCGCVCVYRLWNIPAKGKKKSTALPDFISMCLSLRLSPLEVCAEKNECGKGEECFAQ